MGTGIFRLKKCYEVALCGYYGFGNLGDELLLDSLVSLLQGEGILPERLLVLSADPHGTSSRLGVPSVNRWELQEVVKALCRSETLLLGAGGLFQDSTSRRSCLYYWGIVRLAWWVGCRPWVFGQSVGPFQTAFAEFLARDALKRCEPLVVRDEVSYEKLQKWGLVPTIAPDPVLGLKLEAFDTTVPRDYCLINIRPTKERTGENLLPRVEEWAEKQELEPVGVAFSEEDLRLMETLVQSGVSRLKTLRRAECLEDFVHLAQRGACAVGMRLHFVELSFLAGLPVVGIPYDPKVFSFCRQRNIPQWLGEEEIPVPDSESSFSREQRDLVRAELYLKWRNALSTALV